LEDGTSFNLLPFITIIILILLNGFFVATEFALVRVRPTRIDQLIKEGNKRAKHVRNVLDTLNIHLAAAQLGITLTSLGIGAVAEPAISGLLQKAFHIFVNNNGLLHTLSIVIAFVIATTLHITIGEQVPKMWAIESAEKISMWISFPLHLFCKVAYPFIITLNWMTNICLKAIGVSYNSSDDTHTEEEIKMIVSKSSDLEPEEQKMLSKIFDFHERFVREIMVHRKDMDCIYLSDPVEESVEFIRKSKHSRFPVCGEDRDDIKGYINVKDLYNLGNENLDIHKVIRQIPSLYETTPVNKALQHLQKAKHQIALVIDEYGGVSGIVTLEDILEEIVGDIQDEFDDEIESIRQVKDDYIVDGSVLVDEVNEILGITLEEIDGIDTIGGLILTKVEHPPKVGQKVVIEDYEMTILKVDDLRILSLQIKRLEPAIKEDQE
jgi:CBS domain containing-hemolysin-like protein